MGRGRKFYSSGPTERQPDKQKRELNAAEGYKNCHQQPDFRRRSRPEPAFLAGAGAGAEKITKFRLRLLVNCKAENYEFKTTLKNLFSSLIQKVVPKVENVNSV